MVQPLGWGDPLAPSWWILKEKMMALFEPGKDELYDEISWRINEYGWITVLRWVAEIIAYIMEEHER